MALLGNKKRFKDEMDKWQEKSNVDINDYDETDEAYEQRNKNLKSSMPKDLPDLSEDLEKQESEEAKKKIARFSALKNILGKK